jgi:hypothetical protein
MGEAMQECAGKLFGLENLGPHGEIEIRGHDDGLLFIAVGNHLEEQLGSPFRKRDVGDLIDIQRSSFESPF